MKSKSKVKMFFKSLFIGVAKSVVGYGIVEAIKHSVLWFIKASEMVGYEAIMLFIIAVLVFVMAFMFTLRFGSSRK